MVIAMAASLELQWRGSAKQDAAKPARALVRLLGLLLAAFSALIAPVATGADRPRAAAATVTAYVVEVGERTDSQVRRYPGRVTPVALANVRAQVSGEILEVCFSNGSMVVQGQTLYRIESVKYEAAVRNAKAKVAECKANLLYAEQSLGRHERLIQARAVSRDAADSALAQRDTACAALAAAEAELMSARDDLKHCTVVAPVEGKAGTTAVTEGNYVKAASEPLVGIVRLQPIRVCFSMSNRDFLSMFGGNMDALREDGAVALVLADGSRHLEKGNVEYVDNITDARTDTFCVYVLFDNGTERLKPGDGVTVVLSPRNGTKRIAVPQTAVLQDTQGAYVWVLDADSRAERRAVSRGNVSGEWVFIDKGLSKGERIVVDGAHRVRKGMIVTSADGS